MAGDYRVIRLRPTDILVVRVPETMTPEAVDRTVKVFKDKLAAARLACADVWILDGGAEIEVLAVEDVE